MDIQQALDDFHIAIKLDSDAGLAYGHAGVAYLHYQHWRKTKANWTVAAILRVDICPLFYTRYGSIAAFAQKTGIQLPADVVDMLCPDKPMPEFEEGARLKLALEAYDREELGTGLSARLAGRSREAFIYAMGEHGLSPIRLTAEELREEAESARKAASYDRDPTRWTKGEIPLLPILNRYAPIGTSADVDFLTPRPCTETQKSHVNQVVLDTGTWERAASAKTHNY